MKHLLRIAFLIGLTWPAASQKKDTCHAGVYLTQSDFIKNRLSHKISENAKGYSFGFPPPADWKLEIQIKTPDTVMKFSQGTVYGYSECGRRFRYSPGGELLAPEDFYRVEEVKGLVIYSSEFVGGDELFYSRDLTSPIHRLSVAKIEEDFKDQPRFIEAVKALNRKTEIGDLGKKDDKGHFIINQVYSREIKK